MLWWVDVVNKMVASARYKIAQARAALRNNITILQMTCNQFSLLTYLTVWQASACQTAHQIVRWLLVRPANQSEINSKQTGDVLESLLVQ